MPSRVNALLINFAVEIDGVRIHDIISCSGFTLGEEGQIEVPEDDRIASIADGRRKIPALSMKYRLLKHSTAEGGTHKYFTDWWEGREGDNRTITVIWLERDRKTEIMRWTYVDCEFSGFKGEYQDYGSPKVGVIEVTFLPYDVTHSIASAGQIYTN